MKERREFRSIHVAVFCFIQPIFFTSFFGNNQRLFFFFTGSPVQIFGAFVVCAVSCVYVHNPFCVMLVLLFSFNHTYYFGAMLLICSLFAPLIHYSLYPIRCRALGSFNEPLIPNPEFIPFRSHRHISLWCAIWCVLCFLFVLLRLLHFASAIVNHQSNHHYHYPSSSKSSLALSIFISIFRLQKSATHTHHQGKWAIEWISGGIWYAKETQI